MPSGLSFRRIISPVRGPVYRPSFSGSLSFIDRLPTRRPIRLTHGLLGRRDAFAIANAVSSQGFTVRPRLSSLRPRFISNSSTMFGLRPSNFREYGDNRTYHPSGVYRPLISSNRLSGIIVAEQPTTPEFDRLDRHIDKLKRQLVPGWSPFGSDNMNQLRFAWPKRLAICLKRQLRREVLASMNVLGSPGLRPPLMRPMSQIRC